MRYWKEAPMYYKTIVFELLQQRTEIYDQLRSNRTLLATLERYAKALKTRHETWQDRLAQARPNSDQSQIASEALEFAVKELEDCLPNELLPRDSEPLSLEAAIAFVRHHTPPA
jgi:chromosome segregation ATPase